MPILEDDLLRTLYAIKLFLRNISKFNIFKILIFEFEIENIPEKIDFTFLGYIQELTLYLQDILNNYTDQKFNFLHGPKKNRQIKEICDNDKLRNKDTLTIIDKVLVDSQDTQNKFQKTPFVDNISIEILTNKKNKSKDNNNESLFSPKSVELIQENQNENEQKNENKKNELDKNEFETDKNKTNNNKIKNHKCTFCTRQFLLQKHLERHISIKHTTKHKCSLCNETFENLSKLEEHNCIENEPNSSEELPFFCCSLCLNSYSYRKDYDAHVCNEATSAKFQLANDKRLVSSAKTLNLLRKLICGVCCDEYRSAQRMACHLTRCTQGPYVCEICKEEFINSRLLTRHKKHLHKDVASFICPECGVRFKLRTSLQKHLVFRHERAKDQHVCDHPGCNESFSKRIHLTIHQINVHKLEKKYLCQDCGKQFLTKSTLLQHMRYHQNENRFKCTFCNRVFKQKEKLIYHMRLHTGERPHLCNLCGKRFIRKSKLEDHMRRHSGERIKCPLCPKTYGASWDLKVHIKSKHTNEQIKEQTSNIQDIQNKEIPLNKNANITKINKNTTASPMLPSESDKSNNGSISSCAYPRQQIPSSSHCSFRTKTKSISAPNSFPVIETTSSILPQNQIFSTDLDSKQSDFISETFSESYPGDPNRLLLLQVQPEYSQQTPPTATATTTLEPAKVLFVDPSKICFMVEPHEETTGATQFYKLETNQDLAVLQESLPNPSGGIVFTSQPFEQTNFGF